MKKRSPPDTKWSREAYETLTDFGQWPVFLPDSRRILCSALIPSPNPSPRTYAFPSFRTDPGVRLTSACYGRPHPCRQSHLPPKGPVGTKRHVSCAKPEAQLLFAAGLGDSGWPL